MTSICQRIRFDMPYPRGFAELPRMGEWRPASQGDSSMVEQQTHNLSVAGSNPVHPISSPQGTARPGTPGHLD